MKYYQHGRKHKQEEGPSPHGEGGLKYDTMRHQARPNATSLPTRGGWIEICFLLGSEDIGSSPSPHGEGGLK